MNVIGLYAGSSDKVDVKKNFAINKRGALNHYTPELVHIQGGSVTGLQVRNNSVWKMNMGSTSGTVYGNLTSDPRISYSGARPGSYYMPTGGSPLINAGLTNGLSFVGS